MPNSRKEDTTPATKADIALVLDRLNTLADDISGLNTDVGSVKRDVSTLQADVGSLKTDVGTLKTDVGSLKTDVGTLKTDVALLQKAFAKHEKTMQAQFMLVFEHIERTSEESREHLDEKLEKHDTACLEKAVTQGSVLRDLSRRLCVVERRVGVPS